MTSRTPLLRRHNPPHPHPLPLPKHPWQNMSQQQAHTTLINFNDGINLVDKYERSNKSNSTLFYKKKWISDTRVMK